MRNIQSIPLTLQIKNLARCPQHFETVCLWLWKEWGKDDGKSIRDISYRTKHALGKRNVPMTFVALLGEKPVGTFSLWTNDLKSRQDLTPWLAVLYVVPQMRRQGIGSRLQGQAVRTARKLGYRSLYLITDKKGYYEKSGWSFLELAPLPKGRKTRIYEYRLR